MHLTYSNNRGGFTLIELLVVVAMIAVLMGAFTTSVTSARERARVQKATSDVKVISQAILSSENFARDEKYELPEMDRKPADLQNLGFLLGREGEVKGGGKMPALIAAALSSGGAILDPWGRPYLVTIKKKTPPMRFKTATGSLNTGFHLPNLYRISEDER